MRDAGHQGTLRELRRGIWQIVTIKALASKVLMTACLLMLVPSRRAVKFVEHDGGEVDIDALNGRIIFPNS